MSILDKINSRVQKEKNTGFGENASNYGGRFINKDGSSNIEKQGISFLDKISWFHTMITLSRWKFLAVVILFFLIVNFFFASLYYIIGIEHLNGISATNELEKFAQAYFFSAQTFTTVGYGHISPTGILTSAVAAWEAIVGLLAFALATGLLYGRFSRPIAHIKFSKNALIAPYKERNALMIRISPFKNTSLIDVEAKMTLGIIDEQNGVRSNNFYSLNLEMTKINALTLSWTLVHNIDESSPLYNFKETDYNAINGEFIIYVKGFDEMFNNTVSTRSSYTFNEIIYGAKFVLMFHHSPDFSKTILEIDKLNQFELVKLN